MVGTGALTTQPVSVSGTGTESFTGTGAVTLAPATVSGTGAESFPATGSLTLQPVSTSGTGVESFPGSGALTLQPAPRVVRVGDEVHFSVQGSGDLLNYRWRRNGVNLESGGRVRGAASATLRIFSVHPDDAGLYECVLINPCGTTTSTAALLRIAPAIGSCAYDFNQDGNVDLLDAQQIAQVALSLREPDAAWLDGDVNSDGETTISDAQVLAMYVVSGVCGL
jgi:hypothetical protein